MELSRAARERRERTLKVGHEGLGTAVQGIDDHLAVGRTGDFDPAIFQAGRRWRAHPGGISADMCGLRREVELLPRVETLLDGMTSVKELQARKTTSGLSSLRTKSSGSGLTHREPRRVECPVESSEECEGRFGENLGLCTLDVGWRRATL